MTRVRLHHQPHLLPRLQFQDIPRRQREMHRHLHPTIHPRHHDHVALLERQHPSRQHIARAQPLRFNRRQRISPARIPTRKDDDSTLTSGVSNSTLLPAILDLMVPRYSSTATTAASKIFSIPRTAPPTPAAAPSSLHAASLAQRISPFSSTSTRPPAQTPLPGCGSQ